MWKKYADAGIGRSYGRGQRRCCYQFRRICWFTCPVEVSWHGGAAAHWGCHVRSWEKRRIWTGLDPWEITVNGRWRDECSAELWEWRKHKKGHGLASGPYLPRSQWSQRTLWETKYHGWTEISPRVKWATRERLIGQRQRDWANCQKNSRGDFCWLQRSRRRKSGWWLVRLHRLQYCHSLARNLHLWSKK